MHRLIYILDLLVWKFCQDNEHSNALHYSICNIFCELHADNVLKLADYHKLVNVVCLKMTANA